MQGLAGWHPRSECVLRPGGGLEQLTGAGAAHAQPLANATWAAAHMGRRHRHSPADTLLRLARTGRLPPAWRWLRSARRSAHPAAQQPSPPGWSHRAADSPPVAARRGGPAESGHAAATAPWWGGNMARGCCREGGGRGGGQGGGEGGGGGCAARSADMAEPCHPPPLRLTMPMSASGRSEAGSPACRARANMACGWQRGGRSAHVAAACIALMRSTQPWAQLTAAACSRSQHSMPLLRSARCCKLSASASSRAGAGIVGPLAHPASDPRLCLLCRPMCQVPHSIVGKAGAP
jgi:hypothetical protein